MNSLTPKSWKIEIFFYCVLHLFWWLPSFSPAEPQECMHLSPSGCAMVTLSVSLCDSLCPQGSVNSVFPKPSYVKSQDKLLCATDLFLRDNLLNKFQQLHSLGFLLKDSSPSVLEEISSILNFSPTFSHRHKTKQLSQKSSVALNTLWIWEGEMPENLWNTAVALDPIWKAITYFRDSWQQIDYGSVSWEISTFCQGWDILSSLN